MTNKNAKRSDKNLAQFKAELAEGHYNSVVGARRGAAYLSEGEQAAALKAVAAHFDVGLDEPGEATRGERSKGKKKAKKKVARKATAKKIAKKAVASGVPAKGAKKKYLKKRGAQKASTPPPAEPEVATASAPEQVKKVRAPRGSKKAAVHAPALDFPRTTGALSELGIVSNICGTVDQALKTIQLAQSLSKGELNIQSGLQEIVETTGAAVASLRKHLPPSLFPEMQASEPPVSAPVPTYSNGERPTNMDALGHAVAAAAGAAQPTPAS
jgi:hypothetical protein